MSGLQEEVKLSRKISTEDFVALLESRPKKIAIPESILKQSKNLRLIVEALRFSYQATETPQIEIIKRGEAPEVLARDDVDPFIRRLVGYAPDAEERLLMKLLDVGATSKQKAQKLSELTQHEIELACRLKDQEHIEETEDMRIYLTSLGKTVAKGAKKMYR